MATVIEASGMRAMKNLGWLLRHWQQVEWLGFNYAPDHKRMVDGEFVAKMRDGSVYLCEYASLSVAWNWCDRPVFRGVEFRLKRIHDPFDAGRTFTVGDANWRAVNRLEHSKFVCFIGSDCVELPANDFYRAAV